MIIVAEFYKMHHEHVPVNASLLYIISRQYSNELVHFYAEENHSNCVKSYLENNDLHTPNVVWNPQKYFLKMGEGKKFLLKRIAKELVSIINLSLSLRRFKAKKLFLLYLSPVTSIFFKAFLWRKGSVVITLHGDVELIRLKSNFMQNFLGRCFRVSFHIKRLNCIYLALEEVIRTNLLKTGLLKKEELIAVPHPYIYRNDYPNIVKHTHPYIIGYIGFASIEKNAFYFYQVAQNFKTSIKKNCIEFILIGKNENIPSSVVNNLVVGGDNKEMLSRTAFEKQIERIHYAIFFHDNKNYRFISSGAIHDAFNFEKPIIALRNDLFESFFERAGKVGFLCRDIEEIELVIQNILSEKITSTEYEEMKANMQTFKKNHNLDNIRNTLFSQLST